jgi:hypothetical protein
MGGVVLHTASGLRSTMKMTAGPKCQREGEGKRAARARLGLELGRGGHGTAQPARVGEGRVEGMEVGCCCGPKGGRVKDSAQVTFSIF